MQCWMLGNMAFFVNLSCGSRVYNSVSRNYVSLTTLYYTSLSHSSARPGLVQCIVQGCCRKRTSKTLLSENTLKFNGPGHHSGKQRTKGCVVGALLNAAGDQNNGNRNFTIIWKPINSRGNQIELTLFWRGLTPPIDGGERLRLCQCGHYEIFLGLSF